jgi:hypothetical protein
MGRTVSRRYAAGCYACRGATRRGARGWSDSRSRWVYCVMGGGSETQGSIASKMSRGEALSRTLQSSGDFDTRAVPATGDCFFDALHLQLPVEDRPPSLVDAGAMRDFVADGLDEDTFALYKMFAGAGVEDFAWLNGHRAPNTLDELRAFARVRGRDAGAGHCFWADERAMQLLAAEANVCVLIIDEQASSVGSRSGRRRGAAQAAATDGRFVMVGEPRERCVLMHRSRRQHFSPAFYRGQGVVESSALPARTRALWPKLREVVSAPSSGTPVEAAAKRQKN